MEIIVDKLFFNDLEGLNSNDLQKFKRYFKRIRDYILSIEVEDALFNLPIAGVYISQETGPIVEKKLKQNENGYKMVFDKYSLYFSIERGSSYLCNLCNIEIKRE